MKKTFLILFSAIFATLLSSCEKETPLSVDTFNTFMEEALDGTIVLEIEKEYVDGTLSWPKSSGDFECDITPIQFLFYSDGTCRQGFYPVPWSNPDYDFYHTLHWEADAERCVIRLTDKVKQEAGEEFAVTELQLTSRSGNKLGFKWFSWTSESSEICSIYSGILYGTAEREEAEERYRSDAEDPLLK